MNMNKLVLICFVAIFVARVAPERQVLHVGVLLEMTNHWYGEYVNFFVNIIEHVFEEVENRTDILADYSLKLITKDTQGIPGLAAKRMVELMTEGPPIVAVIGPTLSSELTVTGQIAPFYDVTKLSYIASTSTTVDTKLFPTLFRINQILGDLNPLRIKMLKYFNWRRVGTIFSQDEVHLPQMNLFHDLLTSNNMTLVTSVVVTDTTDYKSIISRLLDYDVRIIMGSFGRDDAPGILCEAYRQGLYGSRYVWILPGPKYYQGWLDIRDTTATGCTYEQITEALNGYFTLNFNKIDPYNTMTISEKTTTKVTAVLEEMLSQTSYRMSSNYGYVYDTAWSLVLGLNQTLKHLNESGLGSYNNSPYYLDAIIKGMHEVNFAGLSGPVSFDDRGGRMGVTYIEHTFNDVRTAVAMYDQLNDELEWLTTPRSLWEDEIIPQDRFIYHREPVSPHVPSLILIMTANVACLLVAIGFLIFNILYRKNSNIKLSSPMINNIIIAGSIFMFLGVFITTLEYGNMISQTLDKYICMLRVWIMCIGFTSLFGALFSKTWRVHIIFRNDKIKRTVIKDYHLFGIVIFLLFVDCLFLVLWSSLHSLNKKEFVEHKKDLIHLGNIILVVYKYCHNEFEGYWYVSIYIYKGLLLALGTFLAWETRHVTVPALNDSKLIGFCIYNVVIVCIFGVPLAHVLPREQTTLNFVLLSTLVLFCTTMCLCILFIPKIKIRNKVAERFMNPSLITRSAISTVSESTQKTKVTERMHAIEDSKTSQEIDATDIDTHIHDDLKKENQRLRMELATESIAIARLKRDLLQVTGNIHFYKVGSAYVVFEVDKDKQSIPNIDGKDKPIPESSA